MKEFKKIKKDIKKVEKLLASLIKHDSEFKKAETKLLLWKLDNLKSDFKLLRQLLMQTKNKLIKVKNLSKQLIKIYQVKEVK